MAVWSEIKWSALGAADRLDPEYYQPEYLRLERRIKRTGGAAMHEIAFITDGIHASPDVVEDDGVRYLSAKCVRDNDFALADALQISTTQDEANRRTRLKVGDVLLTTVGTIGNAAVVTPEILPANIDRHLGLIRLHPNAPVDAHYVATFLNSSLGRFQTLREATGNVQLNLFIEKIKTLTVPIVDQADEIARQTKRAYAVRATAVQHYTQAEELLMSSLGLDALEILPRPWSVASLAKTSKAERLDAEFYCWPELESTWESPFPLKPLGDPTVTTWLSNGSTPAATDYTEAGIPIVKVGGLTKHGTVEWLGDRVRADAPAARGSRGEATVGDVFVLCAAHHIRYIGKSGILRALPDGPACRSVGELITVRAGKAVKPEVLCTYFNLPVVQTQTQRFVRGQSAHLYPSDLQYLPVPILPESIQKQIVRLHEKSDEARREAAQLLEGAKAKIEALILDDSQAKSN